MIQELLGSGGSAPNTGVIGERKLSIPFHSPSPSPACPAPTTPIFTASGAASSTTNTGGVNSSNSSSGGNTNGNSETTTQQNLRCPRCDSTNTKFCYYNNYNLTQPRHFCKTCRRYWTKGGTLRNVPIGGGCRKNKTTIGSGSSNTSGMPMSKPSSNAMAKAKATLSTEMLLNASPGFLGPGLLDHFHPLSHPELQPGSNLTPALWPSIPQGQSSHILALIRGATQFINPNPSPSQVSSVFAPIKTEGNTTLGLEPYGSGAPSILGSFLRGNQHPANGFGLGVPDGVPNGGNNGANILELYQRLKSSSNYNNCGNENPGSMVLGNVMGSSPSSLAMNSSILEATSGATAENLGGYGMMSSPGISSWSDFPTVPINGAFP